MRVTHVCRDIANQASGVAHAVLGYCHTLAEQGAEVNLHVIAPARPLDRAAFAIHEHRPWRFPRRLHLSPSLGRALEEAARTEDIIHGHTLWSMPGYYPSRAVRASRCRLIVSPHGGLSSWALASARWQKRALWSLFQEQALQRAACLHATSDAELQQLRQLDLRAPIAVIPNACELPELSSSPPASATGRRRLLFLGRIHPQKGVDLLLRAWREVQAAAPEWELHIVGPDPRGHLPAMRELARSLGVERVSFTGPSYGPSKTEAFHRADLFVLPTHAEGFPIAVVEALAHAVPVIVSRGAFLPEIQSRRCGWWIDVGVEPLVRCLREVLPLARPELRAHGERGRAWVAGDLTPRRIGAMMYETYQWVLTDGPPPPWIHLVTAGGGGGAGSRS